MSDRTRGLKLYEQVAVLDGSAVSGSPTCVERTFYYDSKGRLIQTQETNHLGGVSVYSTKYDFVGNVTASHESHKTSSTDTSEDTKLTTFEYDHRSRLLSETTTVNNGTPAVVTYAYDELGKLTGKTYGDPESPSAVTDTLKYNIQGWLTEQSSDLFTTSLDYFGAGKYSGNITKWSWGHGPATTQHYSLTYDKLDRLTSAIHSSGSYNETIGGYDRNGNILSLSRTPSGAGVYNYTYEGNKLMSLSGVSGSYDYDDNGNMTVDPRKGLNLQYNFLNLLGTVTEGSTVKATYRWLADGVKAGVKTPAGTQGYEYLGSLIYTRSSSGGLALESVGFGGGRIIRTSTGGYELNYQITDHLGSVRVVFKDKLNVLARNDYYAFGKRHENSSLPVGSSDAMNRWQFNGKENQLTGNLRFLDYGARPYDSEIGRWFNLDPLAEVRPWESPFAFSANNPVNAIDPDGKLPFRPIGGSTMINPARLVTNKEYRQQVWQQTKTLLTFTDLNDAVVVGSAIVSTFTGGEAVHIDGTPATGEDIEAAKMGLLMPAVSGSAVKKTVDAVEGAVDVGLQGGRKLPNSKIKEAPSKRGNAPVGDDGKPVELHHRDQTPDGPVDEMTRTDHRGGENYKNNHSNTGQEGSSIDRNQFNKQRNEYWKREWDRGRFNNQ